jgi:hypothetical protein
MVIVMVIPYSTLCYYNYHNSVHYPSSCLLLKTQIFGDRILSLSSGGKYSVGLSR